MEDYLAFTGKQKERDRFTENKKLILKTLPSLKQWIEQNPLPSTSPALDWVSLLMVSSYFSKTPGPNLYIRQLPVEVHTKFIEQHSTILSSLLDYIIPNDIRDPGEKRIDRRYYLHYDQSLIRIRVLEPLINLLNLINTKEQSVNESEVQTEVTDISIPLADFNKLKPSVKNVLITENKMNFLTLPELPDAIAIWSGGGFQVSNLKEATWLHNTRVFYWGDMDEHGFQILHQIRSYFSGTKSVMMDLQTLEAFTDYRGRGARNKAAFLSMLNMEEQKAFKAIKANELNRLEQEKIDQEYAEDKLKEQTSDSI